jgi:hypothetical protein
MRSESKKLLVENPISKLSQSHNTSVILNENQLASNIANKLESKLSSIMTNCYKFTPFDGIAFSKKTQFEDTVSREIEVQIKEDAIAARERLHRYSISERTESKKI